MDFYIDIEDESGNRYGNGPIVHAQRWESTERVDKAGDFSFTMSLADPKSDIVQERRYAKCYAILSDGPTLVGAGIIDRIETRPENNGNVALVVTGDDLLRELAWRNVEFLALHSGTSSIAHSAAVTALAAKLPGGWSANAAASPGNNDIYYLYQGESVLAAAIKLAELSRCHVWMSSPRTLTFTNAFADSGLRAIEAPLDFDLTDDSICFIDDFSVATDTYDLISRILPYGAEITPGGGAYVDLGSTTKSAPSGYTLSTGSKYIQANDSEATYGRADRFVKYNDIKPASSAAGDVESAANQLFEVALRELQVRSRPAEYYTLSLAHSTGIIHPMQTIRCVFRRVSNQRNIISVDQNLYILGSTIRIDATGMRTTQLDVATVDRWPPSDTDISVQTARDQLRIS